MHPSNTSNVINANIPKLGQGTIVIEVGAERFELKPTINAMKTLSLRYGGLQDVLDKIQRIDVQVIEEVIVAGLGQAYQSVKMRNHVMEKMLSMGLSDDTGGVAFACQKYVLVLMRGGKPLPTDKDPDEPGDSIEGNASSSSS